MQKILVIVSVWILGVNLILAQESFKSDKAFDFELKKVDVYLAKFQYRLNESNLALFISEESTVKKLLILSERRTIVDDTLMYPLLPWIKPYGKFVGYPFKNLSGEIVFEGLVPQKDYYLHLFRPTGVESDTFELVHTLGFNTLAQEPTYPATNLAFEDKTDTSFVITWLNGDGEGRIVVVAPEGAVSTPEDGRAYQASSVYGKDFARQGNGFVVYDGNERRPKVKITGLKPATKYTVAVYEYNGSGKYRNYNTEPASNNPRTIATKLQAPKITKVVRTEEGAYLIRWSKVVGAYTYILDLAEDKNFEKRIEPYIDIDVGDLGEFELSDLPKKKYYLRIKAKGEVGESNYSPTFEIK